MKRVYPVVSNRSLGPRSKKGETAPCSIVGDRVPSNRKPAPMQFVALRGRRIVAHRTGTLVLLPASMWLKSLPQSAQLCAAALLEKTVPSGLVLAYLDEDTAPVLGKRRPHAKSRKVPGRSTIAKPPLDRSFLESAQPSSVQSLPANIECGKGAVPIH